jgi:dihydroorotate dehydrogenase electron transfer subunit
MVRLFSAEVTTITSISSEASLLEIHAPTLVQAVLPGQYCMLRCCSPQSYDPLLRRPFYVHTVDHVRGLCTFLIYRQGRCSRWLASQSVGSHLDLLGPLGHGWPLASTVRNLLLVAEEQQLTALTLLTQVAVAQEIAVTIVYRCTDPEKAYPPALLPPEVEYHVETNDLVSTLDPYIAWADTLCCSVSHETSLALYNHYERLRTKSFSRGTAEGMIFCGTGFCLLCDFETRSGPRMLCREGPIFDLRELVR